MGAEADGTTGAQGTDVLTDEPVGPPEPPATPNRLAGRRYPFHRPLDYVVTVLIVVVSLVVWFVLYQRSDAHNTTLHTGPANFSAPAAPLAFPPSLAEVWQQPSAASPSPVVAGPNVVTADNGAVVGRDPLTGDPRWSYTRDLGLCTITEAWGKVVAVYHRSTNCSEVTELDDATGARGAQRNGDAEMGTRLVSDGVYVTATGPDLLNTWRSDMVLTNEYGTVPDFVNPNVQPRSGCSYGSVTASPGLIGVIERCPGEVGDRLTVMRAAPRSSDTPSVVFSTLVADRGSRLIAMNDEYTAVITPTPTRVDVFNTQVGNLVTSYPVTLGAGDLTGDPPGLVVPTSGATGSIYWYTGSETIALSSIDFHPEWSVPNTLGAGTVFAGRYLVPVPGALLVLDQVSGARIGTIGVDRHGWTGPVEMATTGPMVLEQRGPMLAALR